MKPPTGDPPPAPSGCPLPQASALARMSSGRGCRSKTLRAPPRVPLGGTPTSIGTPAPGPIRRRWHLLEPRALSAMSPASRTRAPASGVWSLLDDWPAPSPLGSARPRGRPSRRRATCAPFRQLGPGVREFSASDSASPAAVAAAPASWPPPAFALASAPCAAAARATEACDPRGLGDVHGAGGPPGRSAPHLQLTSRSPRLSSKPRRQPEDGHWRAGPHGPSWGRVEWPLGDAPPAAPAAQRLTRPRMVGSPRGRSCPRHGWGFGRPPQAPQGVPRMGSRPSPPHSREAGERPAQSNHRRRGWQEVFSQNGYGDTLPTPKWHDNLGQPHGGET